jgi:hypothetical protein
MVEEAANEITFSLDIDEKEIHCVTTSRRDSKAPASRVKWVLIVRNVGASALDLRSIIPGANFDVNYRLIGESEFSPLLPVGSYGQRDDVRLAPGQQMSEVLICSLGPGRYDLYCSYNSGVVRSLQWRGTSKTNLAKVVIGNARPKWKDWVEAIGEKINRTR